MINPRHAISRLTLIKYHKFCGLLSAHIQGIVRNERPGILIMDLHKRHNAENVLSKVRPVGRCPKAKINGT